jgi:hypothetical protein
MEINYGSAGIALAIAGYVVILCGVMQKNLPMNAVTFLLYVIINWITVKNIQALGGNADVLYMFTIGSGATFLALLYKKQFKWTHLETFISFLIAICVVVWLIIGPEATVIAGATSAGLANVPLLVQSWKNPDKDTTKIWIIFFLCNLCFFKAAKNWNIEEILYPIVAGSFCLPMVIASLRTPKAAT